MTKNTDDLGLDNNFSSQAEVATLNELPFELSSNPHINGDYLKKNRDWHVSSSEWKAQQLLKMLEKHHLNPELVGDVGCGAGEVLRQLQLRMNPNCQFWGYDISPQAIEMSKQRENDRLHFKLADACQTPTPFFDLLLVLEVVDHVEDYFGFLRALKAKSEWKLFHFSLDLSVKNAISKTELLRLRDSLVHLHSFNKETALRTLNDTGYEVIDTFYTPFGINFATGTAGKLAKPFRKLFFKYNQDFAVRLLGGYRLMVLAR